MTNTPWEASSGLYKKLAFGSMIISGTGIILAIIGANMKNLPLMYTAIGIIGVGLLTHIAGMVVRARDAKAWRVSQGIVPASRPRRERKKKS
ncbi:hypothetical protein [Paeniglutamicibacter kerguelensis]|uniref:Threonine/homoserine/homoserine lactone efflux protein n=1 Tax=Paeniglutamicibacter kerguelensis TaxID=254788 RepID=A0ABS4XET4_9MICC|nr:hypothetical protein [Paeniglutamicibacter kerguelensis]MBP2386975.1 threonine/homoserine/homoserine lactone efflux protein [Paeniglutamicibacter kerguelensis]